MDEFFRLDSYYGGMAKNMSAQSIQDAYELIVALRDYKVESSRMYLETAVGWVNENYLGEVHSKVYTPSQGTKEKVQKLHCTKANDYWICRDTDKQYWLSNLPLGSLVISADSLSTCVLLAFSLYLLDIPIDYPLSTDTLGKINATKTILSRINTDGLPIDLLDRANTWYKNNINEKVA